MPADIMRRKPGGRETSRDFAHAIPLDLSLPEWVLHQHRGQLSEVGLMCQPACACPPWHRTKAWNLLSGGNLSGVRQMIAPHRMRKFTHHIANRLEVHCVGRGRDLCPLASKNSRRPPTSSTEGGLMPRGKTSGKGTTHHCELARRSQERQSRYLHDICSRATCHRLP